MDERQPLPTRNSSRTLAKIAVAVLVVIAIAGIVLATLRGRGAPTETPVAADPTQPGASAMTAASASAAASMAAAEAAAGPNEVVFAPGSAELSDPATAKLIGFAETARKLKRGMVVVAGKSVAGSNKMDLARKRTEVIRDVLQAHGVPMREIQLRVAEIPFALDSESEVNRVHFSSP